MCARKVSRSTTAAARRGSEKVAPHSLNGVEGHRHRGFLLPLRDDLEEQLGTPWIDVDIAKFIDLCRCRDRSIYAEAATMPTQERTSSSASL
jgi:hypothetical protein